MEIRKWKKSVTNTAGRNDITLFLLRRIIFFRRLHTVGSYYLSHGYYIAFSMGQIIKSVCVCQCICPFASTLTVTFLDQFSPKLTQT